MMPTLTAEPVDCWGVPRAEFAADADRVELELVPGCRPPGTTLRPHGAGRKDRAGIEKRIL